MRVFNTRNVHQVIPEVLGELKQTGIVRDSRNGPVVKFPGPVATCYAKPSERVIFWSCRDANPFFHLIESLWMLNGRKDVETVAHYVSNMRNYSDNGEEFHGAYGYRWKYHFNIDQINEIIERLKKDPDDRRCVLDIWDARTDLGTQSKDLPCNLVATFQIDHNHRLEMVVFNRSNDIIWGAYGANAVHFSMLQEYVARCVGVKQGEYIQISSNFHVYESLLDQVEPLVEMGSDFILATRIPQYCPYENHVAMPYPLMQTSKSSWDMDLDMFFSEPDAIGFQDPFFRKVAIPVKQAYDKFREKANRDRFKEALECVKRIKATDWQLACKQWLERRNLKHEFTKKD